MSCKTWSLNVVAQKSGTPPKTNMDIQRWNAFKYLKGKPFIQTIIFWRVHTSLVFPGVPVYINFEHADSISVNGKFHGPPNSGIPIPTPIPLPQEFLEVWNGTVDGSEILHQLRLVVYPITYKVLAPSQVVIAGFLNHQQYGIWEIPRENVLLWEIPR